MRSKSELALGICKSQPLPTANEAPSAVRYKCELDMGKLNSETLPITNEAIRFHNEPGLGRLKSEPLAITNRAQSAITSKNERVLGRVKSEPLKFQSGLPVSRPASAQVDSKNVSIPARDLRWGGLLPSTSFPKSNTTSGSAFYSKVTTQVFLAAKQAAKSAKSEPTLTQKFALPTEEAMAIDDKCRGSEPRVTQSKSKDSQQDFEDSAAMASATRLFKHFKCRSCLHHSASPRFYVAVEGCTDDKDAQGITHCRC